jgi:hypothetical protein
MGIPGLRGGKFVPMNHGLEEAPPLGTSLSRAAWEGRPIGIGLGVPNALSRVGELLPGNATVPSGIEKRANREIGGPRVWGLRLAIPGPQAHAAMNWFVAHPLTRVALMGTPNATNGVWEGPPNADLCVEDPEPFPSLVKRTPCAPHVLASEARQSLF